MSLDLILSKCTFVNWLMSLLQAVKNTAKGLYEHLAWIPCLFFKSKVLGLCGFHLCGVSKHFIWADFSLYHDFFDWPALARSRIPCWFLFQSKILGLCGFHKCEFHLCGVSKDSIFSLCRFFLITLKEFFHWSTLTRSRIPCWFLFQSKILGLCGFHLWDFTGAEFQKISYIISLCGFSFITLKKFFYWRLKRIN